MLYYLGKGTEFKKEDCKEYKKLDAALKAAAKDESLVVWDETGKVIGSLTDDIPEGALQTNPDGSVNTYDADGNKTGTVDAETLKEMTTVNDDVSKLATVANDCHPHFSLRNDDLVLLLFLCCLVRLCIRPIFAVFLFGWWICRLILV